MTFERPTRNRWSASRLSVKNVQSMQTDTIQRHLSVMLFRFDLRWTKAKNMESLAKKRLIQRNVDYWQLITKSWCETKASRGQKEICNEWIYSHTQIEKTDLLIHTDNTVLLLMTNIPSTLNPIGLPDRRFWNMMSCKKDMSEQAHRQWKRICQSWHICWTESNTNVCGRLGARFWLWDQVDENAGKCVRSLRGVYQLRDVGVFSVVDHSGRFESFTFETAPAITTLERFGVQLVIIITLDCRTLSAQL
jgi:hypothetical protein